MRVNTNQSAAVRVLVALAMALPGTLHARDPGINQPGALGNPRMDPGINQPGAAGNVGVRGSEHLGWGSGPLEWASGRRGSARSIRAATSPGRSATQASPGVRCEGDCALPFDRLRLRPRFRGLARSRWRRYQ